MGLYLVFAMMLSTHLESLSPRARAGSVFGGVGGMAGAREAVAVTQTTHVLPLEFNRSYPVLVRGDGA
jgi:hypothetical protein